MRSKVATVPLPAEAVSNETKRRIWIAIKGRGFRSMGGIDPSRAKKTTSDEYQTSVARP
jgi:hypothetical protein